MVQKSTVTAEVELSFEECISPPATEKLPLWVTQTKPMGQKRSAIRESVSIA